MSRSKRASSENSTLPVVLTRRRRLREGQTDNIYSQLSQNTPTLAADSLLECLIVNQSCVGDAKVVPANKRVVAPSVLCG